jgi:hypothetical protein
MKRAVAIVFIGLVLALGMSSGARVVISEKTRRR